MRRPTLYTHNLHINVFKNELFLKEIDYFLTDEEDLEELCEIFEREYCSDDFEMTSRLSNYGFDSNRVTMDLCSSYNTYLYKELDKEVEKWIVSNNIQPKNKVGDNVVYDDAVCEITDINSKEGVYYLFIASKGHIKEGHGTHAELIEWEKVDE
jgi:hypothetical protein